MGAFDHGTGHIAIGQVRRILAKNGNYDGYAKLRKMA